MKPTTKLAIAQLLASAGAVLSAFAAEMGNTATTETADAPAQPEQPPQPEKPKRGRPAKTVQPEPEPQADPAEPTATESEKQTGTEQPAEPASGEDAPKEKTYEELRALIEPFVKAGQGADVKKIITKYAPSLKEMEAKHHAAFERDIASLSY